MITFNSLNIGRTIGSGVNDLYPTDFQISTNSTNGIITLRLPKISDVLSERFKIGYLQFISFLIADISGTASVNKTTIIASNGEKVNGASSVDLTTNNYSVLLTITSDKSWSLVSGISNGVSPITPPYNNPFDFYLDSSAPNGGDGSIESPFNNITELNDAVIALSNPTQSYIANVAPSDVGYGSEVVGTLNIAPNLSLIGQTPQNTGFSCDISLIAPAISIVNQYRNVSLNGLFTLDLSLATFASIVFQNGAFNINRIDNNLSSFVILQGGIGVSTIGGTVLVQSGVIFGDITVNNGANLYCSNMFFINGKIKLNGNSTLKTLSTLNPYTDYIDGTPNISGTPTWITDYASNESYTGTLNKNVLGGYVLIGTITKNDVNANVGVSSFVKGSDSYNGRIITNIATKLVQAFDSDSVQAGIIDLISSTEVVTQLIGNTGSFTIFSFGLDNPFIQDFGSTYGIVARKLGKGNFIGGNTTGLLEVYAKFESQP